MDATYQIEEIRGVPYFDLELYLSISRQTRVDGATYDKMTKYWEYLGAFLRIRRILAKEEYYVVWLDEPAEEMVNTAWEESAADGFMVATLAQTMLMAVIQELVPSVAEQGCAPIPTPNEGLLDALDELGLPWQENSTLPRQYAMLTPAKIGSGCGSCHLSTSCPNSGAKNS